MFEVKKIIKRTVQTDCTNGLYKRTVQTVSALTLYAKRPIYNGTLKP